jgi:hypothetical protein
MDEPTISMRDHFEAMFTIRDAHARELREADLRAVALAREADQEKIQLALQNVERQRIEDRRSDENWRANANEYRGQLKDQAASFLTRAEFDQSQRNQSGDRAQAGTSVRGTIAIGLTALGIIITLVVIAANAFIGN